MRETKMPDGLRVWTPEHPGDIGLLNIAEGASFGETTFPSGWKSPEGKQVAHNGKLYEVASQGKIAPDVPPFR